ncbi:MAG: hypothetical protein AAFN79_00760 [Pseudomonadota bacterium]
MTAPAWRRLSPRSGAARLAALGALVLFALLGWALVFASLQTRLTDARERAASLYDRAAALEAAADALAAESSTTEPDAAALQTATAWLDEHAPIRAPGEAELELLSALRLLAQAAEVELASVSALDASRDAAARDIARTAAASGLSAHLAEARLVADHAGLARFLTALEATRPTLRAAALEITARSPAATAEARRLSIRVTVAALSRRDG